MPDTRWRIHWSGQSGLDVLSGIWHQGSGIRQAVAQRPSQLILGAVMGDLFFHVRSLVFLGSPLNGTIFTVGLLTQLQSVRCLVYYIHVCLF
jgi:hypothetical protein